MGLSCNEGSSPIFLLQVGDRTLYGRFDFGGIFLSQLFCHCTSIAHIVLSTEVYNPCLVRKNFLFFSLFFFLFSSNCLFINQLPTTC